MSNNLLSSEKLMPVKHHFEPYADNGGSSLAIAGDDFCVVASDTRQSSGYNINSRNCPKSFQLTEKTIICVNGYHADGLQLTKDIQTQIRMVKYQHDKVMSIQSLAQLTMTILYGHRFFPYYTFTLLGGIDENGHGAVFSFDPVGSFERECYRAGGSASALIQPFLDSQIGCKNQNNPGNEPISLEFAIKVAKDAFTSAAERDIYTGDSVQIWIITNDGCRLETFPIRQYRNDSRYKRYVSAVERNLATFESISEWADIIAFLSRLNKTLSSHPQFPVIPKKLIVCKRLAQCLNPNLPSGVHQKTLETYSIIFQKIGVDGLIKDIPVYSYGIFPFFEFASSSTRMEFLEMINRFFVPLGDKINSLLQNLVLALLPGLEEESSDCFVKAFKCFEAIGECVGRRELLAAMWKSMILSPKHRLSVCNFFGKLRQRKLKSEEAEEFCAGNLDLVITALSLSLEDQHPLVVRSVLDVVCAHFPISCEWLDNDRKVELAQSVLLVLLRRDMSLSRRVYQWILSDTPADYDETVPDKPSARSSSILVDAIQAFLKNYIIGDDKSASRPFKVLIYLNDKSSIMEAIFSHVVIDLIEFLSHLPTTDPNQYTKTNATAVQLFGIAELRQVWSSIITSSISVNEPRYHYITESIIFSTKRLSICDDEASYVFAPLYLCLLLHKLTDKIAEVDISDRIIRDILDVFIAIVPRISFDMEVSFSIFSPETLDNILEDLPSLPSVNFDPIDLVLYASKRLFEALIWRFDKANGDVNNNLLPILEKSRMAISVLFKEIPAQSSIFDTIIKLSELESLVQAIHRSLRSPSDMPTVNGFSRILLEIRKSIHTDQAELQRPRDPFLNPVLEPILNQVWNSSTSAHVPSLLCALYEDYRTELDSFFSRKLGTGSNAERALAVAKTSRIWTAMVELPECPYSLIPKSIVMLIELLADPVPEIARAAYSWFNRSVDQMPRILEPLLTILIDALESIEEPSLTFVPFYSKPFNADQICYCFQQLISMLDIGGLAIVEAINRRFVNGYIAENLIPSLPPKYQVVTNANDCSLILAMLLISIPYACAESLANSTDEMRSKVDATQIFAQKLIIIILDNYSHAHLTELNMIYDIFLEKLQYSIQCASFTGQPLTVRVLDAIMKKICKVRPLVGGSLPDSSTLSRVIAQILRVADSTEVIQTWIEFLCSAVAYSYSEDCLVKLVEPQCQVLLERISGSGNDTSAYIPDIDFMILSSLSDILVVSIGPLIEQSKSGHVRSPSFQTLPSTIVRPLWTGVISSSISSRDTNAADKLVMDLKLNPVSALVPFYIAEIGKLSCKFIGHSHDRIFQLVNRIYIANPITTLYTVVEYLGSRIEIAGDNCLIIDSPISSFFMQPSISMNADLLKVVAQLYRSMKDSKNDNYSKLNFEAFSNLIHFVSVKQLNESEISELLGLLTTITKDALGNSNRYRSSIYLLTHLFASVFRRSISVEVRRTYKEPMDAFYKLLEVCISLASKSNDAGLWGNTEQLSVTSDDSLHVDSIVSLSKDKASGKAFAVIIEVILPQFEHITDDYDKTQPLLSSILNQLILPNLKFTAKMQYLGALAVKGLVHICHQPNITKYWKREFWEAVFLDNQFFSIGNNSLVAFIPHMQQFLSSESDKLSDLLSKIPSSGSSNLFLSREMESLNRAMMIRRLSFVAFCVDLETLKSNMPNIQEKIVDILRLGVGISAAEIFFLLRVLLHRLGEEMPSTLWPVIVTEIYSILKGLLKLPLSTKVPIPILSTVAQACRLIDFIFLMGQATPLLYFWVLIGNKQSDMKDNESSPIEKIVKKYGWSDTDRLKVIQHQIMGRKALVPARPITSIEDLADFFCYISQRLKYPQSFSIPLDHLKLKQEFVLNFIDPIKTSSDT